MPANALEKLIGQRALMRMWFARLAGTLCNLRRVVHAGMALTLALAPQGCAGGIRTLRPWLGFNAPGWLGCG